MEKMKKLYREVFLKCIYLGLEGFYQITKGRVSQDPIYFGPFFYRTAYHPGEAIKSMVLITRKLLTSWMHLDIHAWITWFQKAMANPKKNHIHAGRFTEKLAGFMSDFEHLNDKYGEGLKQDGHRLPVLMSTSEARRWENIYPMSLEHEAAYERLMGGTQYRRPVIDESDSIGEDYDRSDLEDISL
jgi:hypothetical protein